MNGKPHAFLFMLFISLQANTFAQNLDTRLLRSINKTETSFKNKYLEANASSVNNLGIGIPVGMAVAGFISHDKKLRQDALYMGVSFFISGALTQSLKKQIKKQRPNEKYAFIVKRDDEGGGMSFPSGHTSEAFCTATSLALRYHKWYVIAPAYIYASSVGWARMYQGVHYPSDVLAGAFIGAGSAWLGWKLQKWMNKRHK
jgi:membrane-associated phospholipid phosphatase